ncbi:hypothetical protein JCM11641_005923 [Rhodosporidiobolus odoratus]
MLRLAAHSAVRAPLRPATVSRSALASFSTSPLRLDSSSTSAAVLENLVGGKAGIARKKQEFEDKYRAALEAKAKAEGVSVEQLKAKMAPMKDVTASPKASAGPEQLGPVEAGSMDSRKSAEEVTKPKVVKPLPSAKGETASEPVSSGKKGDSPVKPLHDIMDLSKVPDLTTSALSKLWTTYHQAKGFLSAAIPTETYLRMINSARRFPIFVLPLTRTAEMPEGQEAESATEMHLLEWAVLPQPTTVTEPVPPPSTVLFTPLAEYKARQSFAQPYLILTHYTDLSTSHGLVLMRGEISANVTLNTTDAQVLAVRMQLFYNDQNKGGEVEQGRRELLRAFHQKPEEFNVDALIKLAAADELR